MRRRHAGHVTVALQAVQRVGVSHHVAIQEGDGRSLDDDLAGDEPPWNALTWSEPWSVTKNFGDRARS